MMYNLYYSFALEKYYYFILILYVLLMLTITLRSFEIRSSKIFYIYSLRILKKLLIIKIYITTLFLRIQNK